MAIPNDVVQWLQNAGYEHHCFISWPHVESNDVKDCARNVKRMIREYLSISVSRPEVFLDEDGIPGGAEWEETLRRKLCRSVTMVAICAPIYYDSSHKWCGLEWAAMDMLSTIRLAGEGFKAIIPLIIRIREDEPLPEAVANLQYFDFSRIMTTGRGYYKTKECRENIRDIVNRIDDIAVTLANRQAQAACDKFQIPTESAFAGYQVRRQPAPFRS
jgi:hypothetical protein